MLSSAESWRSPRTATITMFDRTGLLSYPAGLSIMYAEEDVT
jgi:hypothetical protein